MSKLDCALDLARKGFRVFPLPADDKAMSPKDLKTPHLRNWPALATTDEKQINKWWSKSDFNIGLATGQGVVVLDYDMKEGQLGAKALELHDMLGLDLTGMNSTTATGGKHYLFRTDKPIPNSAGKVYTNVDVRGEGGYIVAPGSTIHGVPYHAEEITDIGSLPGLPEWIAELAIAKRSQSSVSAKSSLVKPDQPDQIHSATKWLQNDAPEAIEGHAGDETTYKTACKVRDFGISKQTCLELMLDWNEHKAFPPWNLEDLEQKVANAYNYATLPAGIADAKTELQLPQDVIDEIMSEVSRSETKQTTNKKLFYVDFNEAADTALAVLNDPLIEDLFDCGGLSAVYGKPGQGKTFVELDIAFHVAAGRPWNGHAVKQGLVIYVAAEGGRMVYKRLRALKQHYGVAEPVPLALVPCPINLLDAAKTGDTAELLKLIRDAEARYGQSATMIVIDTLSRALAGGDENSSTDMGTFVRHVDKIRQATKAHVSIVAHSGKDQAKGLRGWSGILAALDTELEVHEGRISVTKQRDMDPLDPVSFVLKVVDLGTNARGVRVTSCVIDTSREAVARAELDAVNEQEEVVLEAIREFAKDDKNGQSGQNTTFSNSEISAFMVENGHTTRPFDKGNLSRVLSKLSHIGQLKKGKRGQWVIP